MSDPRSADRHGRDDTPLSDNSLPDNSLPDNSLPDTSASDTAASPAAPSPEDQRALQRWRLVLGEFAEPSLGSLSGDQKYDAMDRVLNYLYGREYGRRGVRGREEGEDRGGAPGAPSGSSDRRGGSEDSVLGIPEWIQQVRELFPQETAEVVQGHALSRYGLTELVTDPEILEKLEPNYELLKAVLSFRGLMRGRVLEVAHRIIRQVVAELRERLAREVRQTLWGRLNKRRHSSLKIYRNLDWRRTIRANLKNFDRARRRLALERLHFHATVDHHLPWHIVLAVDCSGSMLDSVIYSAVMAGIFHGLPGIQCSLIAFDTNLLDLSSQVDDPAELLMSVQLGGGTDIHRAVAYCERLVERPRRTVVVLVTDFFEGGSVPGLLAAIRRLREADVRVIGLAALDDKAAPIYDQAVAQQCVDAGAEVAAVTPRRLAQWLGDILS